MKRAFLALSLALAPAAAFAGNYNAMPTPDQDQKVPVFAIACQDAQGRSLPPGSATCVQAQAQAVSGTVTANQGAPNAGGNQAWPVTQASQPLPTGASTAANQTSVQSAPGTSAGTAQAVQGVTGGVPQNVAASSLPLPANAAQESGGNLATLVARTPALVGGASPVTDANNASYGSVVHNGTAPSYTFAAGTTVISGRALWPDCPSGTAGTLTLQFSDGSQLPYQVTGGTSVIPGSFVQVVSGPTGCTYRNVN